MAIVWPDGVSSKVSPSGRSRFSAIVIEKSEGDATWLYTSNNDERWNEPGGDFADRILADAVFESIGAMTFAADALTELVQRWVNGDTPDRGTMLRGNEETDRSAVRFGSRANDHEVDRPVLRVELE